MRTLTSIAGNSQRLDGGAMFGNAPRPLWSRWMEPDDRNRIALATRALLVRDGSRNILLETGIGAFFDPAMKERFGVCEDHHVLLDSLADQGLAPDAIDVVVLSHLHFDHAGGMLTAHRDGHRPELVFPRAEVVVGDANWQRARSPHVRDRASFIPALNDLLADCGRLELVTGDSSRVLGPGYRFWRSDGHTPGMLLTEIEMPDGPVVFAADLIPGRAWMHAPMSMGYDRYPERLIDEKIELLDSLHDRSGRIFFTHDPDVSLCTVSRDDRGRYSAGDCRGQIAQLDR